MPGSAMRGRRAPLDPAAVTGLALEEVHEMLDRWFALPSRPGLAEVARRPNGVALVFGDTHSDWPTTRFLAERALAPSRPDGWLVGMGDYVDRTLPELPSGSVTNALYLLSLQVAYPDRVLLLRGNHETQRQIPILRREVDDEANRLWGATSRVAERIEDAFDRLPLAASTESGAYMAHAGFPRQRPGPGWRSVLDRPTEQVLEQVVWNDLEGSAYAGGRGLDLEPIGESETLQFLRENGWGVFLRGHDPSQAGKVRFQDHVLTLHSSRVYDWAGLHFAEVPLDRPVRSVRDLHHEAFSPPALPPAERDERAHGK